jgi:predicted aspartyl protease
MPSPNMNKLKNSQIQISGKLNNKEVQLVVDTGADVTVLNNDYFRLDKIIPIENNLNIGTANNDKLNIIGKSLVDIKIGNIEIKHECIIVENLCSPILVGMDLLKILKTIINLDNKSITFKQKNQREIFKIDQNGNTQN